MRSSTSVIITGAAIVVLLCPFIDSLRNPKRPRILDPEAILHPRHNTMPLRALFTPSDFRKIDPVSTQVSREELFKIIRTKLSSGSKRTFYDLVKHPHQKRMGESDTELVPMPMFTRPQSSPDKNSCSDFTPFNKLMCPTRRFDFASRVCITEDALCDGSDDCPMGEDEEPSMCLLYKWIFDYLLQIGDDVSDEINYLESQVHHLNRQLSKLNVTVTRLQQIAHKRIPRT